MKKFLVILMVVAMASVLFVGCTTPPTPEPEPEPTPTPTPTVQTETPYISNIDTAGEVVVLGATTTQYLYDTPTVTGVGVAGAIIKVYIDGVQTGVGTSGANGAFGTGVAGGGIPVTFVTLTDGVKVLHVTATLPGFAESNASTKYTFTLDTAAPKIASVVADSSLQTITVTFDKKVTGASAAAGNGTSATLNTNYQLNGAALTAACTKISSKVVEFNTITFPVPGVDNSGTIFVLACRNIVDTSGNNMATTFTETYVGVTTP